jgi:hypothetical protein
MEFKRNTQIQKKQVFERLIIISKELKMSIYKTSCGTVALYGPFFLADHWHTPIDSRLHVVNSSSLSYQLCSVLFVITCGRLIICLYCGISLISRYCSES